MLVYLNGEYMPHEEARVPVDDRGFLFADGVYEVIRLYQGRPFLMAEHLRRMAHGLAELQIDLDGLEDLASIASSLVEQNGLHAAEGIIYIQITRGTAPRKHAFPDDGTPPTVYLAVRPLTLHPDAFFEKGVAAITVPDTRWTRCDLKTISLLPNVLANQQAKEAGAFEALFVRDGVVLEGSLSNLFGVYDGTLVTYPKCNYILPGITRDYVLEIAAELDIPAVEAPIFADRLHQADELFLSGTTTEIMPVNLVDGRPIGSGRPGPVTLKIQQVYRERT